MEELRYVTNLSAMGQQKLEPSAGKLAMKTHRLKQFFLAKGKLTGLGAALLFLTGLLVLLCSFAFLPTTWMKRGGALFGLVCMAIAGFSGRAKALGLPPPFTNDPLGWRKAKATYHQPLAPNEKSDEKPEAEPCEIERK